MANAFEFKSTLDTSKMMELGNRQDEILIGFPSGMLHVSGDNSRTTDMAEDAMRLSYGTATIPARPFLEEGMINGQAEIAEQIKKHYERIIEKPEDTQVLWRIATTAVAAVQNFVRSAYYRGIVPNAPSTIYSKSHRQKGKTLSSDIPLIDTGQMVNSVTSVINGERI